MKFTFLIGCLLTLMVSAQAQQPELVVQLSHSSLVNSVMFSPDGKVLATAGEDNTAKVWDVRTGLLLRTLQHRFPVEQAVFSANGRALATVAGVEDHHYSNRVQSEVCLWDATAGWRKLSLSTPRDFIFHSVAFSPDGRVVASAGGAYMHDGDGDVDGNGTEIRLWSVADGRLLRRLEIKTGRGWTAATVAFSPDGQTLACGNEAGVQLWNWQNGKRKTNLPQARGTLFFSATGQSLAAGNQVWDLKTGKLKFKSSPPGDAETPSAFSRDLETLVRPGTGSTQALRIVNARDNKTKKLLGQPGEEFTALAISPDAGLVAGVTKSAADTEDSTTSAIKLWNARSGKLQWSLQPSRAPIINSISLRDAEKSAASELEIIAAGVLGKKVKTDLWSAAGEQMKTTFVRPGADVTLSPDGQIAAINVDDETIDLVSSRTGTLLRKIKQEHDSSLFHQLIFSPDGTQLVSNSGGEFTFWRVDDGAKIKTLQVESAMLRMALSPTGSTLAVGDFGASEGVQLFDAKSGALQRLLNSESYRVLALTFAPNGRDLAVGQIDKPLTVWDTQTGNLKMKPTGEDYPLYCAEFSATGNMLASGSKNGAITLWDVPNQKPQHTLRTSGASVTALAFSADERILASADYSGMVTLWNIKGKRASEVAQLFVTEQGDWIVATPDGRFDTNNLDDIKGLHWVLADDPFTPVPIAAFMRQYYEPRLLSRTLKGEKFKDLPNLTDLNRVQPRVFVHQPEAVPGDPDEVSVQVEVARGSGEYLVGGKTITKSSGVHDVKLFRDGQLVGFASDDQIAAQFDEKAGRVLLTFPHIRLPRNGAKKVEFSAYCFNVDQVKSETDRREYSFDLPPRQGKAYIVTVGVNASQNPDLNLRYAVPDAQLMASVLEEKLKTPNAASREYSDVVAVSLLAETDENGALISQSATEANFKIVLDLLAGHAVEKSALEELQKQIPNLEKIEKATPEDLLIISFSCHGDLDDNGVFHLLPYDVGGSTPGGLPYENSISSEDLSQWLRYVDAGEMAMIVDACHSAGAVGGEFKPGPMGSRGLGQLAYDKGMRILAASQSDAFALESSRIQHGLLTFALLIEGIERNKADYKPVADKRITLDEWLGYGLERVPSLADEVQKGTVVGAKAVRVVSASRAVQPRPAQLPSLFDFQKKRREVVLGLIAP